MTPDKGYIDPDLSDSSSAQPGYDDVSRLIVIEPVTIKAPKKQPKKFEDKYAKMFQSAHSGLGEGRLITLNFSSGQQFCGKLISLLMGQVRLKLSILTT